MSLFWKVGEGTEWEVIVGNVTVCRITIHLSFYGFRVLDFDIYLVRVVVVWRRFSSVAQVFTVSRSPLANCPQEHQSWKRHKSCNYTFSI